MTIIEPPPGPDGDVQHPGGGHRADLPAHTVRGGFPGVPQAVHCQSR